MSFAFLQSFMARHPTLTLYVTFQSYVWSVHLHAADGECLLHVEGEHIESTLSLVLGALQNAELN